MRTGWQRAIPTEQAVAGRSSRRSKHPSCCDGCQAEQGCRAVAVASTRLDLLRWRSRWPVPRSPRRSPRTWTAPSWPAPPVAPTGRRLAAWPASLAPRGRWPRCATPRPSPGSRPRTGRACRRAGTGSGSPCARRRIGGGSRAGRRRASRRWAAAVSSRIARGRCRVVRSSASLPWTCRCVRRRCGGCCTSPQRALRKCSPRRGGPRSC
jgi:hypothetical protein